MRSRTTGLAAKTRQQPEQYADGKEYIVSLKAGVDYDKFWTEMETDWNSDGHIPQRPVRFVNERPLSQRSCHYVLTDAEAQAIRNDSRVDSVVIPLQNRGFHPRPHATQTGNFTKPINDSNSDGNMLNWGLVRHNSKTNNYGTELAAPNGYDYTLDGTGVDVIIMDTGIQADHPEFTNAIGDSRVQLVDWYQISGLGGTMPDNHYQDTQGHGTHVAGIAAGKTFGWAKNANIYSVKLAGLEGEEGGSLPYWDAFDVIIGFHNNKSPDLVTGLKRPTIVNMSWGFGAGYYYDENTTIVTGGSYRGHQWTGSGVAADVHAEYGMGEFGSFPFRDPATDSIIEEMIDSGIHICIASGNDGVKIDIPGGFDYNNYFIDDAGEVVYYNRGSSPYSPRAINVGALDTTPFDAGHDRKVDFSEGGPGVDIYTAGYAIMSATSNTNTFVAEGYSDAPYYLNGDFKQANLSGTSMASPQACGLGALILQINNNATPVELKVFVTVANATNSMYASYTNNSYTDLNDTWGGAPAVFYNKFNSPISLTIKTV